MDYYFVSEEDVRTQQIRLDCDLQYSEFFSIYVDGTFLHPGYDNYELHGNILKFNRRILLKLNITIRVECSVDGFLLGEINSCSKDQLVHYLISNDKKERQLAEVRNKQLQQQEALIKKMAKEQVNASYIAYASNRNS